MYNTIVVGFDGSEYSRAALIESANRIRKHGGKLILLSAVYFDEEEYGNKPEQLEKRMTSGQKLCSQAKDMVQKEFGIEIESLVCEGEPHEVIARTAQEKNADLIAMGTHGRRGIKRFIMGSVTSGVIGNASCDVLVVKKQCTACTGVYESLLVPFDGSEFSKKALSHARALSKDDGAEITALYVIPRYEEMIGFMKTDAIKDSLYREAGRIIEMAKEGVTGNGATLATAIEEGHAADKIVEMANKMKSDLIVIGSHGWRGVSKAILGSTTERVIMDASCPILVVK
ncbi:MAG: universal stress protein [Nitrospirota bacterium]|nr:universal stress protein [Nitrospirota bacterium]